ncbi:MAG: ABC transporter substrate-binding protein [Coriobacteriales bacterium]|nr:ABC transporter substrate-binding protein [Coriobacteriales bacterium]
MERTNFLSKIWFMFLALFVVVVCGGLTFFLTGCGESKAPASNNSRIFTDDADRQVALPSDVELVVPSGAVSQQVLLTLCPEKLGSLADPLSDQEKKFITDEKIQKLPATGSAFGGKGNMNKESIASLGDADKMVLVDVGDKRNSTKEELDKLQADLGLSCIFINAKIDSYKDVYTKLGEALQCEERGKELADYCEKVYKETKDAVDKVQSKKKLAYITGFEGVNAIAKGSYQSNAIDLVAENVIDIDNPTTKGAGDPIDLEQLANWNPEIILFQSSGIYSDVDKKAEWQALNAIKEGLYYEVPDAPYCWICQPPSVNQMMGIQWMSHLFYPEQFNDTIADCTKNYLKTLYKHDASDAEIAELLKNAQ